MSRQQTYCDQNTSPLPEHGSSQSNTTTVTIIGAGPIGIELAIALQNADIDYILFESKQIGDAFMQWPPDTHFYSAPEYVGKIVLAITGQPPAKLGAVPVRKNAVSGDEVKAN